jgi:putative DNA methylase
MTQPYRKKLIEVALPLEAINAACKADKDRSVGTIRNLHKWFAPMPVPALRALIFAALVDDPGDDATRQHLLELISNLVASVVDNPPRHVIEEARAAIKASISGELPIVFDPFCGGGSTLVEAQRLGLSSVGSDLNPIPVLISKVLTELPPTLVDHPPLHGTSLPGADASMGLQGFVADVVHYAARVRDAAHDSLNDYYPDGPDGNPVVAWIWARTVESPDPQFQGCRTPLMTSFWLSRKKGERAYLLPDVEERAVKFTIETVGEPPPTSKDRCLLSGSPISFSYIRKEASAGRLEEEVVALITQASNGRGYFLPDERQRRGATDASRNVELTDLPLPLQALGFRVQGYGMKSWSDLFTPRQQLALITFADLVANVPAWVEEDGGDQKYGEAIASVLGLCVGKLARLSSKLVGWRTREGQSKAEPAFGQHIVSMTWDFAEVNPFGGSVGDWMQVVETTVRAFDCVEPRGPRARVRPAAARTAGADLKGNALIITDPPYFAAIGYANLSDYFYTWIRRALLGVYPELFSTIATPKDGELIAEPARHASADDAKTYFIDGFTETFSALSRASRPDLPLLVVYAYKEQEAQGDGRVSAGWEAMLEAVLRAGLTVVGTWPVHGTGSTRMRGKKSNALATYVVMVCRPRLDVGVRVSRRDFIGALRAELGPAVRLLQSAAIAPVDLAQAVIGPGMAVFSRYQAVVEVDGAAMAVRDALLLINSVLAEVLDEQENEWDPETRWAVTWFEQHEFAEGSSGEADSLARAKVTSIDGLQRAGIVVTRMGKTRLVRREEVAADYDPSTDARPTVWELVQHLVRTLDTEGEEAAARVLVTVSNADAARDLAYRLHAVCERRGWAEQALAFNILAASWSEIVRLATSQSDSSLQQTLGV